MKRILIILLLLNTWITVIAQWIKPNSTVSGRVNCIVQKDNKIFLGTENGIYYTTDYFETITAINNGLDVKDVRAISFIDETIFAGTWLGGIYSSTNNGISWSNKSNNIGSTGILSLNSYPSHNGGLNLMAGTIHRLYHSTNKGESWQEDKLDVAYYSLLKSYAQNIYQYTLASTNKGVYKIIDELNPAKLLGLENIPTNDIIILNNQPIIATKNGLYNFFNKISNEISAFEVTVLSKIDSLLIVGTKGNGIFISPNGGNNFFEFNNGLIDKNIKSLSSNSDYLFAGSETQGIWRIKRIEIVVPQNKISIKSVPEGGGVVYGAGDYSFGRFITITANANVGYRFNNWSKNATEIISNQSAYKFYVNSNMDLQANFIKTHKISIENNPSNYGSTIGSGIYDNGTSVELIATPSEGKKFINWTENGNELSKEKSMKIIADSDRNIVANFALITKPNAPIAINATSINQNSFRANWQTSNEALGYFIDVSIDENFNNILTTFNKKDVKNALSLLINNLSPKVTYYYRLKAYNIAGESDNYSNTIKVSTLPTAPTAPIANNPTEITKTGFKANWEKVTDATGYFLDLAIDNNFINLINKYNNKDIGNVNSLIISELTSDMTYHYRIRAYNTGGTSTNSNKISIALSKIESLESKIPITFSLSQNFPNPFNPTTNIEFGIPKESFVSLKIFDVLGNELATLVNQYLPAATYSIKFDATKYNNGIYFYKLDTNGFSQTRKMILLK